MLHSKIAHWETQSNFWNILEDKDKVSRFVQAKINVTAKLKVALILVGVTIEAF